MGKVVLFFGVLLMVLGFMLAVGMGVDAFGNGKECIATQEPCPDVMPVPSGDKY